MDKTVFFFSCVRYPVPRYGNKFSAVANNPDLLLANVRCSRFLKNLSIPLKMLLPNSSSVYMTMIFSPLTSDPPFSSVYTDPGMVLDIYNGPGTPLSSPSIRSSYVNDSDDEDDHNHRVVPHWQSYRHLLESHGYHLDTCKDVRQFYLKYWESRNIKQSVESCAGYRSACREGRDEDELCKDEGLVSPCSTYRVPLSGLPSSILDLGIEKR